MSLEPQHVAPLEIAIRLRRLARVVGVTREEMAQIANVSVRTVDYWLAGQRLEAVACLTTLMTTLERASRVN